MGLFAARHRYILREILAPFILGLAIFTFILLMGRLLRLVELVLNKGVPLVDIIKLFVFLLPSFLVLTLPLAFLLGVLLGFGRLSTDAEIIALKSSGISLYDLSKPVLVLSLLVSLATGALSVWIQPHGDRAFKEQVFHIAHNRATIGIEPRVFNDEFDGLVLYANDVEDKSGLLEGLFISDQRLEQEPSIIIADKGRAIPDPDQFTLSLRLRDGTIHRQLDRKNDEAYQIIDFDSYDVQLDLGSQLRDISERRVKESELSFSELQKLISESEGTQRNAYLVEHHQRLVLAPAATLLAIIGIPLGIQSRRSGRGSGFALALIVFLAYYLLFSFAQALGTEGIMPPWLVLWLPNGAFLFSGIWLLHFTAQEKKMAVFERFDEWKRRQVRRIRRRRLD